MRNFHYFVGLKLIEYNAKMCFSVAVYITTKFWSQRNLDGNKTFREKLSFVGLKLTQHSAKNCFLLSAIKRDASKFGLQRNHGRQKGLFLRNFDLWVCNSLIM